MKTEIAYLATGSFALLIVVAWAAINPFAAVLVLLPLLGAHQCSDHERSPGRRPAEPVFRGSPPF
ncbi:MAG TPA: hypothetical protein VGP70_01300 [Actinomadura sp.]|nr:hypothetical protein [Actinomadura sp.]